VARRLVGWAGELLVTAGALILLFVVYQLFWTNVAAHDTQQDVADRLEQRWRAPDPSQAEPPRAGDGLAFVRIPRLGAGYRVPIVEGVGKAELAKGIGHYPGTAGPGEVGNFAVAGHRATNGEPFAELPRVRVGDDVVVETGDAFYTYRVVRAVPHAPGHPSYRLVSPHETDVLAPVPDRPGVEPTQRRMTLTTCHPRWGSSHRLIVYAVLESTVRKGS
jgi:sortase A